MDSDSDSDFYGDDETVTKLQKRVDNFDMERGWENQQLFTSLMSQQESGEPSLAGRLHNMYEGHPGAWQLNETVDNFLSRLPPSSTRRTSELLDWIRIWNPYLPPQEPQLVRALKHAGKERLDILSKFMAAAKASADLNLFQRNSEIEAQRKDAIDDLRHLAVMTKVLGGKWMLFVDIHNVDEVWSRVARATAKNELGIAAKVALDSGSRGDDRLICVYTRDFRDTADIARVLNKLRSLELIRAGGRQIYYKTDAWTELGLYGGNDWQIPASMHSSNEIFAYINQHGIK